jgi:hypothetical protein
VRRGGSLGQIAGRIVRRRRQPREYSEKGKTNQEKEKSKNRIERRQKGGKSAKGKAAIVEVKGRIKRT